MEMDRWLRKFIINRMSRLSQFIANVPTLSLYSLNKETLIIIKIIIMIIISITIIIIDNNN